MFTATLIRVQKVVIVVAKLSEGSARCSKVPTLIVCSGLNHTAPRTFRCFTNGR